MGEKIQLDSASGLSIQLHDSTTPVTTLSSSSDGLESQQTRAPRKFLWIVPLKPHVHPLQLLVILITVFASLAAIVYLAGMQSADVLARLPTTNVGDVTGSLSFYSEIISLVFVVVWGVVSDHQEKRLIMVLGLVIMGIIVIATPYVKNVYPDLLMTRIVFSVGTAATTSMMTAFTMEVVHGQGGLVSGMLGASSGLGALFAAFCLFEVPTRLNWKFNNDQVKAINSAYGIIGGCLVFVGLAAYFLLPRSPAIQELKAQKRKQAANGEKGASSASFLARWSHDLYAGFVNFGKKLYYGFRAAKDPRIALGYCTSFFARADEVIITNFVSLWVTQYYIDNGTCARNSTCYAASGTSGTLTGIAQAVALVACPFFAAGSEYLPKEFAIVAAGAIGAAGCLPFAFSIDPTSQTSMAMVVLIAIGQYGMIISGMSLVVGDHVPVKDRGSCAGTYSFSGALGIIILSKIGGVLFDKWMKGAPFLLLGIGHILVLIGAVIVYIHRRFFKT
ncbi:major facilitator superfamily domain-containing protein [Gongronella butleri]|nr:major facilitator superfamily domain-containing protein [Gongronella butleri]